MTNSRDLILKLKEVKERDKLSLAEIETRTEQNGEHVSKTTLSRVFSDGSEDILFKFESTLKPIANALLDIDTIEDDDDLDTQGLKIMLKLKADKIKELEAALDHEKVKHHEKLDKEREQYRRSIEYLKKQVDIKDNRIDILMNAVIEKDRQLKELFEKVMHCPHGRKLMEG
jgi:transcriptional regulator with XRE-family HTH domain